MKMIDGGYYYLETEFKYVIKFEKYSENVIFVYIGYCFTSGEKVFMTNLCRISNIKYIREATSLEIEKLLIANNITLERKRIPRKSQLFKDEHR